MLGQTDHRVLNDIQRTVFVANGVDGSLESSALDTPEEVRKFFVAGQGGDGGLKKPQLGWFEIMSFDSRLVWWSRGASEPM